MTGNCVYCGAEKKRGKFFCSKSCSAKSRKALSSISTDKNVQESVYEYMLETEQKIANAPKINSQLSEGELVLGYNGDEYRPDDNLTRRNIDLMLKSGLVNYILEAKRSPIVSVFRTPYSWGIESDNKSYEKMIMEEIKGYLPKFVSEIFYSGFVYGAYFGEIVYEQTRHKKTNYIIPSMPLSIHPLSIKHIKRTPKLEFNGFVQETEKKDIDIPVEKSLVVPFNETYRNLFGKSYLTVLYPYWFWFEVVLRAMVRYMQRMATPVTVARAPSKGKVRLPNTNTLADAMVVAYDTATKVAYSDAVVIPSETDDNGKYLWNLEYLESTGQVAHFIDTLKFIVALTIDSVLANPEKDASSLHTESLLTSITFYLNKFFLPKFVIYNSSDKIKVELITQGVNNKDLELLIKLFSITGNVEGFSKVFELLDWELLAKQAKLPVLESPKFTFYKGQKETDETDKQGSNNPMQGNSGSNKADNRLQTGT